MTIQLDPETYPLPAALAPPEASPPPTLPAGNWTSRHALVQMLSSGVAADWPTCDQVLRKDLEGEATGGTPPHLRLYRHMDHTSGPLIVYVHGGGMIAGSDELYDSVAARYTATTGIALLSVAYRLAPERPHPTPILDVYAALSWAVAHKDDPALTYGIAIDRMAVMGG